MTEENGWERWFAWRPIEVDAYSAAEIKNGKTRYNVFGKWVERCWVENKEGNYENDQDEIPAHWKYRMIHDKK